MKEALSGSRAAGHHVVSIAKDACTLQVWKAKGLLFSLSDDGVNAHHVPAFKLACQAGRSRGANQFAFDETRAMLCVVAKRRLILSHYNGVPQHCHP